MPDSLPLDVGQAIKALKEEFEAQLKALEARVGQAITNTLNSSAASGQSVPGDSPEGGKIVDAEVRTFVGKESRAMRKRVLALEQLCGLAALPDDQPMPEYTPAKRGRKSAPRDENGKVVDPVLPRVRVLMTTLGVSVEQLAALLGVRKRSVYRWMSRDSSPNPQAKFLIRQWDRKVQDADDEQIEAWRLQAIRLHEEEESVTKSDEK